MRSARPAAVSSSVSRPPKLCPITVARSMPAASSVSRRSSTCCAIVHGGSQPERPWPRRSGASTRKLAQALLGQSAEAAAVGHDAVEAEDGRSGRVAPLVDVQEHAL